MKTNIILTAFALLAASGFAAPATNDAVTLLQRGLFEEEANHQLDAAIGDYKEAIEHFDRERQLAATAIFRLGECYRKLGRTNEANAQYERIAREFPDQTQLLQLSRAYLPSAVGASGAAPVSVLPSAEEEFLRQAKEIVQNSPDLATQQLHTAVEHGYVSAAEFLLAHGADVNSGAPIVEAARRGNEAMVQLLLSHGAAVDGRNANGQTALPSAAAYGFMAVCQTLISNGADVNLLSPIVEAAKRGNEAIVQLLLSHGAAVDSRDAGGRTALSWAAESGYMTLCQTLVVHGADVNAKDNSGWTPLFAAVEHGKLSTVEFLITNKAQINAANPNGQTPLFYAIGRINMDMIRALIEHGADVNILDKNGFPPLAFRHSPLTDTDRQIEELLIKAGADPDYARRRGIWTSDPAGKPETMIFSCPTNSVNHYTLLDFLGTLYEVDASPYPGNTPFGRYAHYGALVQFPDFSRLAIHRLGGKRPEVLRINVADILATGDGSKDIALQAGDLIEIPNQEHKVADRWWGLSLADVTALNKCLLRGVQVISQGHTNDIVLLPSLSDTAAAQQQNYLGDVTPLAVRFDGMAETLKAKKADTVVRSFLLNKVANAGSVLLNTWDLSRVRLTRGRDKMTFDLTSNPPPDVWLENGDVIEIPELGQAAPATESK